MVVSIYQTKLLAEQQELATKAEKAQLWPNLDFQCKMKVRPAGFYSIALIATNVGVGPAIIEDFKVICQGEEIGIWLDALELSLGQEVADQMINELANITSDILLPNQVIPAGEEVELFNLTAYEAGGFKEGFEFYTGEEQPQFEVIYKSVFDDRWRVRSKLVAISPPAEALDNS
ncbi:MAG: hypothetical protein AAFO91_02060 [Bacteroidota bacterium]